MDNSNNSDVQVWVADFSSQPQHPNLKEILSESERDRAARFHFEKHRVRYIFAHAVLRTVLAEQLRCNPCEIEFQLNDYGKPFLKKGQFDEPLTFNMSHSEDLVLIAVARERLIGVDVEFVRPLNDMSAIAERFFTPNEQILIQQAPSGQNHRLFFTCWTRKEAYIKAVGKGLSIPLTSFDVTTSRGTTTGQLPATEDAPGVERWWLSDLVVPEHYAGAVVVEGTAASIHSKRWQAPRDMI